MQNITAPSGARIHTLSVKVKNRGDWNGVIDAIGTNIPADYNVRRVGNFYVSTGNDNEKQNLVLLNYPSGDGSWNKAKEWAQSVGLKDVGPRSVFAIREQHSQLKKALKIFSEISVYVFETTGHLEEDVLQSCFCCWGDKGAPPVIIGQYQIEVVGISNDWFAFSIE